jgi:glycosyltransferase involved in cell wall biosynthesis
LWPRFSSTLSWKNLVKESGRRALLRGVDSWLLKRNVTEVVAQSRTIQTRLAADFGIRADVLWPPPPQRAYRRERYGDEIFVISRLNPLKRVDLLIAALAEPTARHVRALVAGEGESRPHLEALAQQLGVSGRVKFLGRITDDQMLRHLAQCRAVCFTPLAEDYGFVTVEAFASGRAVVTCSDSGGPAELVSHGRTGFVTEPTAAGVATALAQLTDDRALAEALGTNAAAAAAAMTWASAVQRLVIV